MARSAELVELETSDTITEDQNVPEKDRRLEDVLQVAEQILHLDISLLRAPTSLQMYRQRLLDLISLLQRLGNDCPAKTDRVAEMVERLANKHKELDSRDRESLGDESAHPMELRMLQYVMDGIEQPELIEMQFNEAIPAPISRPTIAEPTENLCNIAHRLLQRSSSDNVSRLEYLHLLRLLMEKVIFLQRNLDRNFDSDKVVDEQRQLRQLFQLLQKQAESLFPKDSQLQTMLRDIDSALQVLTTATERKSPQGRGARPKLTRVSMLLN